jgi:hypothetical protein
VSLGGLLTTESGNKVVLSSYVEDSAKCSACHFIFAVASHRFSVTALFLSKYGKISARIEPFYSKLYGPIWRVKLK